MRVIGRNNTGQIVGCFECSSPGLGNVLAQRLDAGHRPIEQACLRGFRESVAWLYAIGAIQLECIESESQPVEVETCVSPAICHP